MNTILNRLLLWQKFALLGLLGAISVAVPLTLFILESSKAVHAAQEEARAIVPIQSIFKVVQMTQQHRGLSAMVLNGNENAKELRAKKQNEVNGAVTEMNSAMVNLGDPDLNDQMGPVKNEWTALAEKLDHLTITGKDSFTEHTALIMHLLKLSNLLIDRYGLSVNPDFDNRYLIESTLVQAPVLTEELGRMRAKGAGLLAAKTANADDRLDLRGRIDKINALYAKTNDTLMKAMTANSELKNNLSDLAHISFETGEITLQMAQENIVKPEELILASATFFDQVTQAINAQIKLNDQALTQLESALNNRVSVLKTNLYKLIVALVVLLSVITWFGYRITVSVTEPLHQAVFFADKISKGDLTGQIYSSSQNETGQLLQALGMMNASLGNIVGKVRHVTDAIASASSQIAAGNLDLSSRTEEEASALEETAATMEQLTATVKNNLSHVGTATQLAASASAVAVKGCEMITRVFHTMDAINSSSKQIYDIIGLIDSIAFQTNILALNAAVEAARAGEQGRGFAVVATEVRNLAQRSAAAAKDIKDLIGNSVHTVDEGCKLVEQAGSTMDEIVVSVRRVNAIMSEIKLADTEQSEGIGQITQAMEQLDEVTQQNAALVEQAAAAAASLESQARDLKDLVSVFHITGFAGNTPVKTAFPEKMPQLRHA